MEDNKQENNKPGNNKPGNNKPENSKPENNKPGGNPKKEKKIIQKILSGSNEAMPHTDDGIEEAVLGGIMLETDTARRVIPTLPADYFYNPKNHLIYEACLSLYKAAKPIDMLTVAEQLRTDGMLETAGGPYNITLICSKVASTAHIDYHISILGGYYIRRSVREMSMTTDNEACDMTIEANDILVNMGQRLSNLIKSLPAMNEITPMGDAVEKVLKQLDERIANGSETLTGIDTGTAALNEFFLGWQKSTLNIIAGRTSEGKTALLMHSLLAAAQQGKKICLVSLESDADKLAERMLLTKTGIDPDRWHKGKISPEERKAAGEAAQVLSRLTILIYDRGDITIERICMMIKALHADHRCDLAALDYLQLLRETRRGSSTREEEVSGYSRMLKKLSLQLEIPVVALCQFNREVAQNTYQIPKMENIRESGAIEQDADTITMIYHPAKAGLAVEPTSNYPVTEDLMVLIVAKNRNGRTGQAYLSHSPAFTDFADYEPPADYLKQSAALLEKKKDKKNWRENNKEFQAYMQQKQDKEEDPELPF